jgi:hypothetical protein
MFMALRWRLKVKRVEVNRSDVAIHVFFHIQIRVYYWFSIWFHLFLFQFIADGVFFSELNKVLTRELAELNVGNLFHQSSNFKYFDWNWFMTMILIKKLWILFLFHFVFVLWYMIMFMNIWFVIYLDFILIMYDNY